MTGSELKAVSRKLMFDNSPRLFFISLLYIIIGALVSWLTFRLPGNIDIQNMYERLSSGEMLSLTMIYSNFRPIGVFLAILLSLFQPLFDVGFMSFCLKTFRKQETTYKDLLDGFLFTIKVLSLFIVRFVLIVLWSLLLIIPGIVAAYKYRLAFYILLDDPKKGVMQCIHESSTIMYGGKVDLFIIEISFWGWFLLDILVITLLPLPFALPIVSVWIAPYMGLTIVGFYEERIRNLAT